jgi:DUF4097 and DUF4098 domain-containing protein YvlB
MRLTAIALVALALAAAPAAAGQKETETVDRTIPFAQGGTLRLKNFSGDVRITGTAGQNVVIHATRTARRDRLENIKLDIQVNGSRIDIEANKRNPSWKEKNENVVETVFEIQVPADTKLDLDTFSSDVVVADTTGTIKAHTFSGTIDLDMTRAAAYPDITAETFSGDIKARVSPGGSGQIEFNTFSGDLRSDLPLTVHGTSHRKMTAEIGGGGGAKMEFKTFSGDVRVVR